MSITKRKEITVYNETHDLMAKEFYWLCYEKFRTPQEMRIWHHAFMELYLKKHISEKEANAWYDRGMRYFDIKVKENTNKLKAQTSMVMLKSLEDRNKTIELNEKDLENIKITTTATINGREVNMRTPLKWKKKN